MDTATRANIGMGGRSLSGESRRAGLSIRGLLLMIVSAFVVALLFVASTNMYAAWNNMAAAKAM